MKTESSNAQHTPVVTRFGNPVHLLGRRNVYSIWAVRLSDNALREYYASDLLHDFGASALLLDINALPTMKPAAAKVAYMDFVKSRANTKGGVK